MDANDAIIRARLAFEALASILATCDDYRERTWQWPEAA
jgi:hypothetical protein